MAYDLCVEKLTDFRNVHLQVVARLVGCNTLDGEACFSLKSIFNYTIEIENKELMHLCNIM